jgi:hypothetical protein
MVKRTQTDSRSPNPEFWFYPERHPELFLSPLHDLPKRGQLRTDGELFEIREWTFTREEQERLRKWDKSIGRLWKQAVRKRSRPEGGQPRTPDKQMDRSRKLHNQLLDALTRADENQVGKRTVEHVLLEWKNDLRALPSERLVKALYHLVETALETRSSDTARASWVVWQLETHKGGISLDQFRRNLKKPPKKTAPARG